MEKGGIQSSLMNYFRKVDREIYQFDVIVHGEDKRGFEQEFIALGGNIIYVPPMGKSGIINYITEVSKVIKENGPYVAVHSHTMHQSAFVLLAAKKAGIETRICHSHSTRVTGKLTKILFPIYKLLIKNYATRLVSCGQNAGEFLYGNEDFLILPNAIDVQKLQEYNKEEIISFKDSLSLHDDSIVLGHIGRFNEVKNHKFLINLIKECDNQNINVRLVLVGDGPLRQEIGEMVNKLNIQHLVKFIGVHDNIANVLHTFDILLLPSFKEGFPVVLVESQAAGVPALASDTISNEVDLGLGLVDFLSIDNHSKWIEKLKKFERKQVDLNLIKRTLIKEKYDINYAVSILFQLYN